MFVYCFRTLTVILVSDFSSHSLSNLLELAARTKCQNPKSHLLPELNVSTSICEFHVYGAFSSHGFECQQRLLSVQPEIGPTLY